MMLFPIFWLRDCFIYFGLTIAVIHKSLLIAVCATGLHCQWDSELPLECGLWSSIPMRQKPYKTSSCLWKARAYFLSCYSEMEKCELSTQTVLKRAHAFILYIL